VPVSETKEKTDERFQIFLSVDSIVGLVFPDPEAERLQDDALPLDRDPTWGAPGRRNVPPPRGGTPALAVAGDLDGSVCDPKVGSRRPPRRRPAGRLPRAGASAPLAGRPRLDRPATRDGEALPGASSAPGEPGRRDLRVGRG